MNHCVRLLLLFTPSLAALGLLGIAFATSWWTISLEKHIPTENSLTKSSDERIHTTLVRVPLSRGLFSECISYRNVKVLVGDHKFRQGLSRQMNKTLSNEICTDNQFQCHTGLAISNRVTRCIDRFERCNRIINCEDKSDETACAEEFKTRDREFFECPTGYEKCPDRQTCYRPNNQTCDGIVNCLDYSDEKNCNVEKCQRNKRLYCPREGKCARRENSQRCDGIVDCDDNSDEENCEQCYSDSLIACDSKCLSIKYRCDGIVHCSDLRDEINCVKNNSSDKIFHEKTLPNGQLCMEQRFNPFRLQPSATDPSLLELYSKPDHRIQYLNLIHYLQLIVFYGIAGGLIFLLLAILSLFFFGCCRRHCISVPFYFYGLWMLLAWIVISAALVSFVFIWLWQKQTVLDPEKSLPLDIDIHERNPTLRHIEFFGLSFWLACGAALASFIGLLLSYCVCCTIGSSRSDDKEYEIMQMHNY